jgi:hypothetical protein
MSTALGRVKSDFIGDDVALSRQAFHDREEFYIKKRSQSFAIMDRPGMTRIARRRWIAGRKIED